MVTIYPLSTRVGAEKLATRTPGFTYRLAEVTQPSEPGRSLPAASPLPTDAGSRHPVVLATRDAESMDHAIQNIGNLFRAGIRVEQAVPPCITRQSLDYAGGWIHGCLSRKLGQHANQHADVTVKELDKTMRLSPHLFSISAHSDIIARAGTDVHARQTSPDLR